MPHTQHKPIVHSSHAKPFKTGKAAPKGKYIGQDKSAGGACTMKGKNKHEGK